MKTIVRKTSTRSSGFEELIGHGCSTEAEMQEYCQSLDPTGTILKVVDAPYDAGETVEVISETQRQLDAMYERADDAGKARLRYAVGEILKALEKPF